MTDYINRLQTIEEVKAEIEKGKLQDIEDYKKRVMERAIQIQNRIIQSRGQSTMLFYTGVPKEFSNDVEEILIKAGFGVKIEIEEGGVPHKVCYLP